LQPKSFLISKARIVIDIGIVIDLTFWEMAKKNINDVIVYDPGELKAEQAMQIAALVKATWPEAEKTFDECVALFMENRDSRSFYVMQDNGQIIASAQTFPRIIQHEGGALEVRALAGVCVDMDYRGWGLGKKLVREVFDHVADEPNGISLFQTKVPLFYEKLGAVIIDNKFYDSTSEDPEKSPWWSDYVMVYSKSVAWPDGLIDLNGAGY